MNKAGLEGCQDGSAADDCEAGQQHRRGRGQRKESRAWVMIARRHTDFLARRLDPERETRRLIARLEALGHQVSLQPAA